ncbi:hypothetical protein HSBAA_50190 [Vreelandella sulfidaeris]|uniref:Uncharacterized protein n=1 Tax=Vreelandella sulfidaeris TaxID=115553 RepID=A0A455UEG4_9GAMM|nr:hypothetical protein HSBAA_14540 [Halomonas sulfidaeris]BBI63228.1 hypothetical protein HSBAA_45340 [Halomonas sulfidaeris]BBI63713.1 hypothetical protein HSBAA_50190 [Halomonas sulfidaeris]
MEIPLQVEPRDQLLDAAGSLQIGRQQAAVEASATATAVTHLGHLHADIPDPGLDRALGQVAVADHGLASIVEPLIGILRQKGGQLGLDGLGDQVTGTLAQQLVQRVSDLGFWL